MSNLEYNFLAIVLNILSANILTAFMENRADKSNFFQLILKKFSMYTFDIVGTLTNAKCKILEFPNELFEIEFNGLIMEYTYVHIMDGMGLPTIATKDGRDNGCANKYVKN